MQTVVATASNAVFRKPKWQEATVLLGLAWLLPLAVHVVPWSGVRPLGAHLLPVFWTTFVAVYFFGAATGALVGLFSPLLNLLMTGLPVWNFVGEMSFEIVLFAAFAGWAIRRWPAVVFLAPVGYVVAKLVWTLARMNPRTPDDVASTATALGNSLMNSIAGLVALAAINAALIWFYPKSAGTPRDDVPRL